MNEKNPCHFHARPLRVRVAPTNWLFPNANDYMGRIDHYAAAFL